MQAGSAAPRSAAVAESWLQVFALLLAVLVMLVLLASVGRVLAGEAASVSLTARDVDGNPVAVPASDRPTAILFVMAGQSRSLAAMNRARDVLGGRTDCQVLAVLSGASARVGARAMGSAAPDWSWPIVVDTDYRMSGGLTIRAWPTTVVMDSAGQVRAHIAGLPASYGKDLKAHIEAAAGRIDADELAERLSSHGVVASTKEDVAARHLEVAQRLMARRQVEQAALELEKMRKIRPGDPQLLIAVAQVAVMRGDPEAALDALEGIEPGSAPAWQVQTVRGRALVALARWEEAGAVLAEALALNPDPVRAHYLLGRVCEKSGDWREAAGHFRAAFEHTAAAGALATHELRERRVEGTEARRHDGT